METYIRVHVENSRTLSLEIVEVHRDWKIKLTIQKGGMCSTTVGFHSDSLEKAKELADRLLSILVMVGAANGRDFAKSQVSLNSNDHTSIRAAS